MKYVLLPRGINVSGKNAVNMKQLKIALEELGFLNVMTYINSGNIIVEDNVRELLEIEEIAKRCLMDTFDVDVPLQVRDEIDFLRIANEVPNGWLYNKEMYTNVIFLDKHLNKESFLLELEPIENLDFVKYTNGALIWMTSTSDYKKSAANKLTVKGLYEHTTTRNINTIRKLVTMIQD